jgi:hypothetical protein
MREARSIGKRRSSAAYQIQYVAQPFAGISIYSAKMSVE